MKKAGNPKLFVIGFIFLILSFLLAMIPLFVSELYFVGVLMVYVAILFFLVAVVLIFLSRKSIWISFACLILPVVIWYSTMKYLVYRAEYKNPIALLIPSDFSGEIRVVEKITNGIEPVEENGRLMLSIPKNGVLLLKDNLKPDETSIEYYLVDSKGQRSKLNITKNENDSTATYPCIFYKGFDVGSLPPTVEGAERLALDYFDYRFVVSKGYVPFIPSDSAYAARNNEGNGMDVLENELVRKSRTGK